MSSNRWLDAWTETIEQTNWTKNKLDNELQPVDIGLPTGKHYFDGLSTHQETQMRLHFLMQPLFAEKKSEVVIKIHQRV